MEDARLLPRKIIQTRNVLRFYYYPGDERWDNGATDETLLKRGVAFWYVKNNGHLNPLHVMHGEENNVGA
jgi:hypothetical protein